MNAQIKKPAAFTFRGSRCMTTHKGFIEPKVIADAINVLVPRSVKVSLRIFHEIGQKMKYEHTHVVWLLSKRAKLNSHAKWQRFRTVTSMTDLKPISTDEHFENCLGYNRSEAKSKTDEVSKMVFDSIGDWEPDKPYHVQVIDFLESAKSWTQVIRSPEHSEYISKRLGWANQVYSAARSRRNFDFPTAPYAWQTEVIQYLAQAPDDRTVAWLFDEVGGNGKSALTNWLVSNANAFCVDGGKQADIAFAYDNQPIVIFDLSRDTEDYCPYRVMESFKNGRIFSSKYQSSFKSFTPPHVIVFANYMPDEKKLSADRWDIVSLDSKQLSRPFHALRTQPEHKPAEAQKKSPTGCRHSIKAPPGKKGKPKASKARRRLRLVDRLPRTKKIRDLEPWTQSFSVRPTTMKRSLTSSGPFASSKT